MNSQLIESQSEDCKVRARLAVGLFTAGLAALPLVLVFIFLSAEFKWGIEDLLRGYVWIGVLTLGGIACAASPFFTSRKLYKKVLLAILALIFFSVICGVCTAIGFLLFPPHIT